MEIELPSSWESDVLQNGGESREDLEVGLKPASKHETALKRPPMRSLLYLRECPIRRQ